MSPLHNSRDSSLDMESESKEKNQNKALKNDDVNRILSYDSIEKPSLEKSPIRPKAFKVFSGHHDENTLNEGFKTPISAKISACNSPMDPRNIFSYGKRLDFSPFNTKNDESPFTCFAKNLRYSPMVNKPSLLWPNAPRGGKSPSPWRLPIEDEDYSGLSPFKRKEFSAMKNRQYSHYDEECAEESRNYAHEQRYTEANMQASPKFRQNFNPQSHRTLTVPVPIDNPFATYREKSKEDEEKDHHRNEQRHYPMRTPSPGKKAIKIHSNAFMSTAPEESRPRKNSESFAEHHSHSEEESCTKKSFDEEDNESTASKKKICCNCKKSRCLKLYCDCFARGEVCTKDCNCVNCLNTETNTEERQNAMMGILDRNPNAFKPKVDRTESPAKAETTIDKGGRVRHVKGCNCKKSGCQKKYCECFQAGVKCTELCKCENCKNCDSNLQYKRSNGFGGMVLGSDSKCDHAHSDISYSGSKRMRRMEEEEEEFDEEVEDAKKYNNPRKALPGVKTFTTSIRDDFSKSNKKKNDNSKINTPRSFGFKREEEELEKSDKKQYHLHYRTPNGQDMKKPLYNEYTPSPGKSMYEGRTRGSVRSFSHLNPDEYEMSK